MAKKHFEKSFVIFLFSYTWRVLGTSNQNKSKVDLAQRSFIIVPLSTLPQSEKTTTKKPKRRLSQKLRTSPLHLSMVRKRCKSMFVQFVRSQGCRRNDASRALHGLVFRYVWSVFGGAVRAGEEAGDDSCPIHFSTEPSGEWRKDCMGTVRLHSEQFSVINHLKADLEAQLKHAHLGRLDSFCRICLVQLFRELQLQ